MGTCIHPLPGAADAKGGDGDHFAYLNRAQAALFNIASLTPLKRRQLIKALLSETSILEALYCGGGL
jgi:hypothetical protein